MYRGACGESKDSFVEFLRTAFRRRSWELNLGGPARHMTEITLLCEPPCWPSWSNLIHPFFVG